MIVIDGVEWATAAEVIEQLGGDVTPGMLRDWKRRQLVQAVRQGGVNHYHVDSALEAERRTREGATRPRRAGLTAV